MARYVIIGAGAVGVSLAVDLQASGREVVLVARGRQLELLQAGQVSYRTPAGTSLVEVPTAAGPDEIALSGNDILVLTTKTQDADAVLAQWARQPVGSRTAGEALPVFTLQNGLDAERSALRRFATVVGSVLAVPSAYVTDGEISAPAPGFFWLGDYPDASPSVAARSIASDLIAAGFEVQSVSDLSRWKAWKLLSSTAFVLDALYPQSAERDRAAGLLLKETQGILAAAGLQPADPATENELPLERLFDLKIDPADRPGSSTFQSLARGRDVETDYLNGEIVLLARQLGLTAPINAALLARAHRAVRDGIAPGSLDAADLGRVLASATVLLDVETLRSELAGSRRPAVLDVRWALGDPDGEKHYLDVHLPDAVYVDLDTELADPPSAAAGRHPLPAIDRLQQAAETWGLSNGQSVVVYDNNGGLSAARAWWLLRWAGVSDVRILDGGLGAWTAAGGEVVTGAYRPEPGNIELTGGNLPVLDADAAAALPARGVLIDARAGERYRGEVEPIDARAGHVPGAISLPTGDNLDADGRFRTVEELRDRFALAGDAARVGVYCGSGVTAAHEVAALQVAGIDAALFPGSWSAWAADPARPVATGPEPA